MQKHLKRLSLIIANSANTLLTPVLNIAISITVIRVSGAELWGAFISYLIWVNLVNHLMQWGCKEYLVRNISQTPNRMVKIWQSILVTRLPFLGGTVLLSFVLATSAFQFAVLLIWGIAAFFHQSFDALITYHRKFLQIFLIELGAIALGLLGLWQLGNTITIDLLLLLFASMQLVKFFATATLFRQVWLQKFIGQFSAKFFTDALPFLLLGLTGMLQSRTDLYCVAYFMDDASVGKYQVFINLMIYMQAFSNIILLPFLKNLYRLKSPSIQKISLQLFGLAFVVSVPALVIIRLILLQVYQLEFDGLFFIYGGLFILPIYFYLPKIYELYRKNLQNVVLWVNFFGLFSNLILNILFIQWWGLVGAIMASAVSQWSMLGAYLFYQAKAKK